jgi:hypothetical protein
MATTTTQKDEGVKIVLTPEKSEELFYDALCNGLSYISDYNLELVYESEEYKKSREKLKANTPNNSVCYEDVLMQMLRDGYKLSLLDWESEEKQSVTINDVHQKVQKVGLKHILDCVSGNDDANTADAILQTVFYGEVLFG